METYKFNVTIRDGQDNHKIITNELSYSIIEWYHNNIWFDDECIKTYQINHIQENQFEISVLWNPLYDLDKNSKIDMIDELIDPDQDGNHLYENQYVIIGSHIR